MRFLLTVLATIGVIFAALPAAASVQTEMDRALRKTIEQAVDEPEATIRINAWTTSKPNLLAQAKSLRSLELLPGERPYGKVTARARLLMKNGKVVPLFVLAEVTATVPVWVVKQRLNRGAPLNEFCIGTESRSLAGLSSNVLRSNTPLSGRLAARSLLPGTLLTKSALTTPRLVRRGDAVSVEVRIGNVVVRATGKALSSGRLGERVRVRMNNNHQLVSGTVEGRGKVGVN